MPFYASEVIVSPELSTISASKLTWRYSLYLFNCRSLLPLNLWLVKHSIKNWLLSLF